MAELGVSPVRRPCADLDEGVLAGEHAGDALVVGGGPAVLVSTADRPVYVRLGGLGRGRQHSDELGGISPPTRQHVYCFIVRLAPCLSAHHVCKNIK